MKSKVLIETNGHKTAAEERVLKCAKMFQDALKECNCQVYTALKVGNAETPLLEIGGFPIVVKITTNDTKA